MKQPIKPPQSSVDGFEEPRFETLERAFVVGLSQPQDLEEPQAIACQWKKFMALYHEIPHKTASVPLGITMNLNEDGKFDYVCATEVSRFSSARKPMMELLLPKQSYAVFTHREHVSALHTTYAKIWNDWFPLHSKSPDEAPSLERHLETFDPRTGMGGVEVWIPVTD